MKTLVGLATASLLSIGMLAAPAAQADYQPNPSVETRAEITRTGSTITVVTSGGARVNGTVVVKIINLKDRSRARRVTAPLSGGEAQVNYRRLRAGNYKMIIFTNANRDRFDDRQAQRFSV